MIFQVAVLLYVGLTCWRATVNWRKRRISYRFFALVLATHLPLGLITLQPNMTQVVAHFAGVGRGVDFVIYCAVLIIVRCLLSLYQWNMRLESEITELIRHLALSEADVSALKRTLSGQSTGPTPT